MTIPNELAKDVIELLSNENIMKALINKMSIKDLSIYRTMMNDRESRLYEEKRLKIISTFDDFSKKVNLGNPVIDYLIRLYEGEFYLLVFKSDLYPIMMVIIKIEQRLVLEKEGEIMLITRCYSEILEKHLENMEQYLTIDKKWYRKMIIKSNTRISVVDELSNRICPCSIYQIYQIPDIIKIDISNP